MALDDPNVIDLLSTDPKTGQISAVLVDADDWTEPRQHLLRLQEKINRYLDFIGSGEIYEAVGRESGAPSPPGAPTRILVMYMVDPPEEALRFYAQVAEWA